MAADVCRALEVKFQSTLPARGATFLPAQPLYIIVISIHAPRTGSDKTAAAATLLACISIHAPRTGSDRWSSSPCAARCHFNPRSPHGERPVQGGLTDTQVVISIHAPRTGSDDADSLNPGDVEFQSTLPARGATQAGESAEEQSGISIHAPRTGSDQNGSQHIEQATYFNPRSPHGERRRFRYYPMRRQRFQSTLPARGATLYEQGQLSKVDISIHAPRTGSDVIQIVGIAEIAISIHAPRTGSDCAK